MTDCVNTPDGGVILVTELPPEATAQFSITALKKLLDDMASGAPVLVILADLQAVLAGNMATECEVNVHPEIAVKFNITALMKLLNDIATNQPFSTVIADIVAIFAGNVIPPVMS